MNKAIKVQKWPVSSRIFHWISAILLLITWIVMVIYQNNEQDLYINLHKAFGLSVLFWMIARVFNRLLIKVPTAVVMPEWQKKISQLTHFALYVLLMAMPVAGLLMSVYGGHPVDMFGLFEIPVFVTPNRSTARFYENIHTGVIWPMIIAFTLLHIGAALYHQFILKDKLINRMK